MSLFKRVLTQSVSIRALELAQQIHEWDSEDDIIDFILDVIKEDDDIKRELLKELQK